MSMRGRSKPPWSGIKGSLVGLLALSLIGTFSVPSAVASYRRPGITRQVDLTSMGMQPYAAGDPSTGVGWVSSVSADGRYVAFTTLSKMVPQDTNQLSDIYLKDTFTGRLWLASQGISGLVGTALLDPVHGTVACARLLVRAYDSNDCKTALSWDPDISSDGRYTTFTSAAMDLIPGDTNLAPDIFKFDRATATVKRVSVDSRGTEADGLSYGASINASGRYVSFTSLGSNLVAEDTNQGYDVFVHDLRSKDTIRVSVSSKGQEPAYGSCDQLASVLDPVVAQCTGSHDILSSINSTGRYVAFDNYAANLVDDDTNQIEDVFVRDLKSQRTSRVSVGSGGSQAECGPTQPAPTCQIQSKLSPFYLTSVLSSLPASNMISANGRYVAFLSDTPNLVPNSSGYLVALYVYDRHTKRTERVSVDNVGGKDVGHVYFGAFSPGGRYATFTNDAHNISDPSMDEDEGELGGEQLYVHDRKTGSLQFLTLNSQGELGQACNGNPGSHGNVTYSDITPSGQYAVFASCDTNLGGPKIDPGDMSFHIFARDRGTELGVGGFGGSPPPSNEPPGDRVCVTPDLCIPPGTAASSSDATKDLNGFLTEQGANLYGASLAYRSESEDLFAAIELEHMPQVLPGLSPIFYGLRFEVEGKSYEVRATSFLGGTFGLFDVSHSAIGTKVADLHGGYGTTGMRVVFSLPLAEIGLEGGGKLKDVEAFAAFGSYMTGPARVLDRVKLK
jgi:hypothetical protein